MRSTVERDIVDGKIDTAICRNIKFYMKSKLFAVLLATITFSTCIITLLVYLYSRE